MLLLAIKINMPVFIAALVIICGFMAYAIISAIKDRGKTDPQEEELERNAEREIMLEETHGVISHMECGTVAGGRTSSTHMQFYVVFRDDFGNEKGFHLKEEAYLALDTDIPGTLATLNGNFYGFCYDEQPEGEAESDATEGEEAETVETESEE